MSRLNTCLYRHVQGQDRPVGDDDRWHWKDDSGNPHALTLATAQLGRIVCGHALIEAHRRNTVGNLAGAICAILERSVDQYALSSDG